jgi:EVE domain
MTLRSYWIGVAAHAHVSAGVAGGFCQLGHGKHAPVKRLKPGDLIVYYSPRATMDPSSDAVQAFTGLGEIADRAPYLAHMTADFQAYRRDVTWWKTKVAPIKPLIGNLGFIEDPARWGYPFHRGAFKVSAEDFATIAKAMGVRRKI